MSAAYASQSGAAVPSAVPDTEQEERRLNRALARGYTCDRLTAAMHEIKGDVERLRARSPEAAERIRSYALRLRGRA